jgi:hypothetical protein
VSSYRDYADIRDRTKTTRPHGVLVSSRHLPTVTASPKLKSGLLVSGNLLALMGSTRLAGRFADGPVRARQRGRARAAM